MQRSTDRILTTHAGSIPRGEPLGKRRETLARTLVGYARSSPEIVRGRPVLKTDGELFMVIKEGAGPKFDMKGFKSKMTDQEIWNIVNYLHSLQAK